MSSQSPWSVLSERLLRRADPQLLDAPLDMLAEQAGSEDVRELFRSIFERGEAHALRDLLGDGRLARLVDASCTAREEDALRAELRRLLGLLDHGGDDPVRFAPLREVPRDAQGLQRWAREHNAQHLLEQTLAELSSQGDALLVGAPQLTLREACLSQNGGSVRRVSLLDSADDGTEARELLLRLTRESVALRTREALWQGPVADPSLMPLAARLRGYLTKATPAKLAPYRFLPSHPVRLDASSGVVRAELLAGELALTLSIHLAGYERRALHAECERCGQGTCVHLEALAGRLLDACLAADDRLHGALMAYVSVPSWQRFVASLTATPARGAEPEQSICFRVRLPSACEALVGAGLAARVGARGKNGKLAAPGKLLRSHACDPLDVPVLEAMGRGLRGTTAQYVPADLLLLRSLVEHPRVHGEDGSPLSVVEENLAVELREEADGLLPRLLLGGVLLDPRSIPERASYVCQHDPTEGVLRVAPLAPALVRLARALSSFHGVLPPESYAVVAPWLLSLRKVAHVAPPRALLGAERPVPQKLLLRLLPGVTEGLDARLSFRALPLGALFPPGRGPSVVHGLEDGVQVFARRDLGWEADKARELIADLGLGGKSVGDAFSFHLEDTEAALTLLSAAARNHQVLDIDWAERAPRLSVSGSVKTQSLQIRLFKKGEWFSLHGGVTERGKEVAVDRLFEAVRRGERFVCVGGSDYLEIESALFDRLAAAQVCVMDVAGALRVPRAAFPYLAQALGLDLLPLDANEQVALAELEGGGELEPAAEHVAGLRSYQLEGVRWLLRRSCVVPGACLADEMGLGKTVQSIALLRERAALGPQLVVAPTSVVDNWKSELARFAPELRVCALEDSREVVPELSVNSVLVLSYDLLLRRYPQLADLDFATQVVDEAQWIKNARTERFKAVRAIRARFRLALSGTPLENRLGDLWSLFALLIPELLGSWERFRARFAVPIERYEDAARAAALRALVGPFMLRRTKEQVARELPERTEVVQRIELSEAEQDLYDAAVRAARRALGKRKPDDPSYRLQVLAELTRLRQLACHPRLVLDEAALGSSKQRALLQLLEDVLPRGHRALIFSQFTRHLGLLREALDARGMEYLYLDGQTPARERSKLVDAFQQGTAPVFLISLKAGGAGLNLTAADYVVHLDPWWNPAAEDQASDRAHRIGQRKPVTIVKLVAQGTIEEKVLGLHGHKRRLAASILSGETEAVEALSLDEMLGDLQGR